MAEVVMADDGARTVHCAPLALATEWNALEWIRILHVPYGTVRAIQLRASNLNSPNFVGVMQ